MLQYIKKSILLLIFTTALAGGSVAGTSVRWVKPHQTVDEGAFFFNVLRITNESNEKSTFDVKVNIPEGSRMLTTIPTTISLDAGASKNIPVRVSPSKRPVSLIEKVTALIDGDVFECTYESEIVHQIKIAFSEGTDIFYPGQTNQNVTLYVENKGNVVENLNVEIQTSTEIILKNDTLHSSTILQIKPGEIQNISLPISIHKRYYKEKFDRAVIFTRLFNNNLSISEEYILKKYNSTYDKNNDGQKLPSNKVQLSSRTNINSFDPEISINAQGKVSKGKGNIHYNLSAPSLSNLIKGNSINEQLDIRYQTDYLNVGIGRSGQGLSSSLFKNNSLFIDKRFQLNDNNQLQVFGNGSYLDHNYGVMVGYLFNGKKISTESGIAINEKDVFDNSRLNIQQQVNYYINNGMLVYKGVYQYDNNRTSGISNSYNHIISMKKYLLDKQLEFDAKNYLNSVSSPSSNKITTRILMAGNYKQKDAAWKTSMNISSGFQQYTASSGDISAYSSTSIQNSFHLSQSKKFSYKAGTLISLMSRQYREDEKDNENVYNVFAGLNYSSGYFRLNSVVQYGFKNTGAAESFADLYYFKTQMRYDFSGLNRLFVDLDFADGANQSYSLNSNQKTNVELGWEKGFINSKSAVSFSAGYNSYEKYQRDQLSLSASFDVWLPKNINLSMSGSLNAETNLTEYNGRVEGKIAKYFNMNAEKNEESDVKVLLFKDTNGNEYYNEDEEVLAGVKVVLYPENLNGEEKMRPVTLVSGMNGFVVFQNIPNGSYSMQILPLKDLGGYYNFNHTNNQIIVLDDTEIQIGFARAAAIHGSIELMRTQFSSMGGVDIANIRISATAENGRTYAGLTDRNGNFTIYVPMNNSYAVSMNNIFGSKFKIKNNNVMVNFIDKAKVNVEFEVSENKRKINFSRQ